MKLPWIFFILYTSISANIHSKPHHLNNAVDTLQAHLPVSKPRLVMYAQTFMTPDHRHVSLFPLTLTRVTHVILASVHLHDQPGIIKLNNAAFDDPIYAELWTEVRALQEKGIKVMALLGGAAGGTYERLSGTETEFYAFYRPFRNLIKHHKLDGLDIDIEEEIDISVPLRLMNALYRDMGPDFIITMTPLASALSSRTGQNLSGFSYFDMEFLATVPGSEKKLISWYNVMFYGDYPRGAPTYNAVLDAGWEPERIVMVVLDNPENGPPNGFKKIETLQEAIGEAVHTFPGFGGVAGWEYYNAGAGDWDVMWPWHWVDMVGDALFDPSSRKIGVIAEL